MSGSLHSEQAAQRDGPTPLRDGPTPLRNGPAPRSRSWVEVRWRQFRNAPPPVSRAVLANLGVATLLGIPLLGYDLAVRAGAMLPGGDLRIAAVALYVCAVVAVGSIWTYLWVPLPSGSGGGPRRTRWSAAIGAFAALPIAYLVLVAIFQVIEPAVGR